MLVIAACDQDSRSRHGSDCLDRRVRVGSLGIVVVTDSGTLQNKLDTVLNGLKFLYCFSDQVHRHAHADAHGYCCHDILVIVLAEKLHIRLYI